MDDMDVDGRDKARGGEGQDVMATRAGPPEERWLVDVDVYLEAATNPPRFRLETCLPMDRDDPLKVITFYNRGRKFFDIRFNLIDETGQGYVFPRSERQAMWSRKGPGCPPKDHNDQWEEFEVQRVVPPDRTTLVVRNKNETVTEFGYTLRVTNDDGQTFLDLDPGGSNQNGQD